MSITIKDIAKIAGVSHTTVSRALNDNPIIKQETRDRIKKIALEHHYIPNYNAKSLKLDRSFNIGLFFTSIESSTTTSFFHNAIKGCHSVLKNQGYNLVVKSIEEYSNDFATIDHKRFDGIILVSQSDEDDHFIQDILNKGIPFVVVNRRVDYNVHNIFYNDKEGAYQATKYLIENGHKKIGFITGKSSFRNSHEREAGFRAALKEADILFDKSLIQIGDFVKESGYIAMKELLKTNITSVFCSNDEMAIGAIKVINESGMKVPEDISVIGFDNTSLCEFSTPTMTSVNRSTEEMVRIGSELLLESITENKSIMKKVLSCDLILRHSVTAAS